jgi:uncharacterized RDD family membrane protein YckC
MSDQTPQAPQNPGMSPAGPAPVAGYEPKGPSGPRAGFGKRFLASLVDALILGVVGSLIGKIFGQDVFKSTTVEGTASVSYSIGGAAAGISVLINLAYYTFFEGGASGQTLGKKLLGIRVIDFKNGGAIGYGRALIRYIGRIVSAIPCLLGYFWMLWDKEKQTWHDKFATSIVVPTDAYPVQ